MVALFPAVKASQFWCIAKDGDEVGRAIYKRHYSYRPYADGRKPKLFVGPGGKLVLVTPDDDALFVWRLCIDDTITVEKPGLRQTGISCAVFRNESADLSSAMILDAEPHAWAKWPAETRLYTQVDRREIRSRTRDVRRAGHCFIKAGWRHCGTTKGGLAILEKFRPHHPVDATEMIGGG